MRQLVVLSGKGGTGKTTVSAALAHLASLEALVVSVDADVDAPNFGILLQPRVLEETPFSAGKEAAITREKCTRCGSCEAVCRFGAVVRQDGFYRVEQTACEGCAACFYQCPADAIEMRACDAGCWYRSETRFGPFLHARLYPGQENSGKLVTTIRQEATLLGHEENADWVIVDGPPGIGCPVIAAVTGADLALMVTEPTVTGLHDLKRILGVVEHFQVPAVVCINKGDLNPHLTWEALAYCSSRDVLVLAEIPYDESVTTAMSRELAVTEMGMNPVSVQVRVLWERLKEFR